MWQCTLTVLIAMACAGCNLGDPAPSDRQPTVTEDPADALQAAEESGSIFDRPAERLFVEFKVHRISAAAGSFGDDSELWNIVTHKGENAETTLRLSANGIRFGVGRESDRRSLLAFIEGLESPRTAFDRVLPDTSRHVDVDLGVCDSHLTMFYYDASGALHGLEFEEAEARFKLAFSMRSTNLKEVFLTVVPELEEPPDPPKWVIDSDGKARQAAQERKHPFEELTFTARIPEGGFLILAPTEGIHDSPLAGRAFFLKRRPLESGPGFEIEESIFVISPTVRSLRQGQEQGVIEAPADSR